jgi:hypothetical protein
MPFTAMVAVTPQERGVAGSPSPQSKLALRLSSGSNRACSASDAKHDFVHDCKVHSHARPQRHKRVSLFAVPAIIACCCAINSGKI